MIVRVLTARVKAGRHGQFNELVRAQLPILREHEGLVYVKLARRLTPEDEEDVILFEEWRDSLALHGWAGPDITKPRLLPGTEEHVINLEVSHYEALDIDPSQMMGAFEPPVPGLGPDQPRSAPTDRDVAPG
jgi:Antibiotic biosynthesis monooxygenase